ncbi:hypothetical protein BGZ60DRAFT_528183 [Tricladium varicosporioides]|nr:hypothetical protein BGZ60DRAFT_528183 [Hymenoscyphus varicosporioides]
MPPALSSILQGSRLNTRMVPPLPPSTYVEGGKLAAKTIVLIVVLVVLVTITSLAICYCCCQRQIWRFRARRIANAKSKEIENRGLRARIHRRNAKFYAPGLALERERQRERVRENWEMGKYGLEVGVKEVEKPKRVWGRWKR